MGFVLEVVSVASLVVGLSLLDAMALLHIGLPWVTLIDHVVSSPGNRFCFVGSCRLKMLKLAPDLSQQPAETPLTSAH